MHLTNSLHRCLQQTPHKIATIFRGRQRRYDEFCDRVARLAGALKAAGMKENDRVGVLALNSDRYLEIVMAVWWGGGVLNPVNIRWSVPEIVYSLDDCDTSMLFIDDHFLHMAAGIAKTAQRTPVFIHASEGETPDGMLAYEQLIADTAPVDDVWRGYEDLAIIMYTGGTTGFRKGVMQSHRNIWSGCIQRMAETPPIKDGRSLHAAPLFHAAALSRAMNQFIAGETHVIMPAFNAVEVLTTIARERVDEVGLVPTMIQALVDHPEFAKHDLSSVKRLAYGASPIIASVLECIMSLLPGVEFYQSYGLTETMVVTANPPENHGPSGRESGLSLSVGRSLCATMLRIGDESGRDAPRGTVGEIVLRGPSVTRGYWNKPAETEQALRNGWLHTGDGAYMDDAGHVFIVDRIKDMIVSGGENVYSAEVENVIARHPAVSTCAVIGVPSAEWGETVHAVVVRKPNAVVSEEEIREHCRAFIARYKCPKSVEFRDQMPLSGAGKILKRELRAPYWEGKVKSVT
ncbi:Long-chain-fatty-acid-CoA ligase [Candidatus Burkholderia verschuerenii]|uniref:Long-chain-fatty-acid-CoA ligase n=1 Tax=Candidatus Burkholderia verschuerenii TaxID=242163 RepID=A0A0L0MG86_9BURK|nr:long-chain fatty acid--CoA ligase [Candidatus Burkholderia verschuerenii]KND61305.1 Long-chain-fatty-acid-CoA ligase [Candidatus Burkholderia verschuerenii]